MATAVKNNVKMESVDISNSQRVMPTDVQSYLISGYRDALKRGDKSAAKSCLLAARNFSVNDPHVTNEIYNMAKSDGDVSEASKCFANIFNDLFMNQDDETSNARTSELLVVSNQVKEEIRILMNELKTQYLKLKTLPAPASLSTRTAPSVNQSPMLSPRMRMSSEDRSISRDSVSKLDNHLHSSTKTFFYQQMFEALPDDVKKSILNHAIETNDNTFDKCRLMMLTMTIFGDTVSNYGARSLRTLIELSESSDSNRQSIPLNMPRPMIMCRYAKGLLVLDAIPLVLSLSSLSSIDVDMDELTEKALRFYSEQCLESAVSEYDFSEMHEGLKKYIAARILGKECTSTPEDIAEEQLSVTLNLLRERYLETMMNEKSKSNLEALSSLLFDNSINGGNRFNHVLDLIKELNLNIDIPDDILFASSREDSSQTKSSSTPPPKGRGRPKKAQQASVVVSPDDELKKQLQMKSRETQYVYLALVRFLFNNCASYLKQTRTRILLSFANPLADLIETNLAKGSSSRPSRSKHGKDVDSGSQPHKKLKVDPESSSSESDEELVESPLNSKNNQELDLKIIATLFEAHKCIEFLETGNTSITKLWRKFSSSLNIDKLDWFKRIRADCFIFSKNYDAAIELLSDIVDTNGKNSIIKKDEADLGTSTLTINTGSPPVTVFQLRGLVQLVCCQIQKTDLNSSISVINELLSKIKQSGLLNQDDGYSSGNIMDEHMVVIQDPGAKDMGFLFFDLLSIMRYVVGLLMDILRRLTGAAGSSSDLAIGHAIALSQFDWPRESHIYDACIDWIRNHKPKSTTPQCLSADTKFTYQIFFNYIRNPNIIEDFMALLNQGYTIDIKNNDTPSFAPSASSRGSQDRHNTGIRGTPSRSGKAITTRGVNKTFKEDLKVALIGQMKESTSLIPLDLISEFIQEPSFVQCLTQL